MKRKKETAMMGKKYKVGFYGGKFLPFHKGHAHCIDVASGECDILYVGFFYTLNDDIRCRSGFYDWSMRLYRLNEYVSKKEDNIKIIPVDILQSMKDGEEDWYAEADYIRYRIGKKIDAIYSSEPSYDAFFKEAYPESIHILIDPERKTVPISGTMIRSMQREERDLWTM